jgi:hypothetical protein
LAASVKQAPPPTPQPPPSSTSKTVNATIKIERNEGSGVVLPGQQYKYPNLPGYNGFPSTCLFTSADPAIIQVQIWYYDPSGNAVQWGATQTYGNSSIIENGYTFYPTIDIQIPDAGYFWIEMSYTAINCTSCCGSNIISQWNNGFSGCDPTPLTNNLHQGKPKFTLKTSFKQYPSSWIDWSDIEDIDIECICNC